jgi:hypothetical protein
MAAFGLIKIKVFQSIDKVRWVEFLWAIIAFSAS